VSLIESTDIIDKSDIFEYPGTRDFLPVREFYSLNSLSSKWKWLYAGARLAFWLRRPL